MPTYEELKELRTNCIWQWTTQTRVQGYRVISKKNGLSIFLPAAGKYWKSYFLHAGERGQYWSKTRASGSRVGHILDFTSENTSESFVSVIDGLSIRPVCP